MPKYDWKTLLIVVVALCVLLDCPSHAERVLVVTSGQSLPVTYQKGSGEYVVSDLVAAGLPFDVVTYSRFVSMSLVDYDVVVLNGHTSPVPVADVAAKCQTAIGDGRKIFINGLWPYKRYDTSGSLVETLNYSFSLFNATDGGSRRLVGNPVLPKTIEKAPSITAVVLTTWINTWSFATPPPITMTLGGGIFGFLCPSGGAVDGSHENFLTVLDYGKVVSYLRNGCPTVLGFANDRIGGKPLVSFEVHCDRTKDLVAIDGLNAMSRELGIPLINLLVYRSIDTAAAAKWNNLNNPLMTIGSHSRNHPQSWPPVPDVLYETSGAIADQRVLVPSTINYFNFSGGMDPTTVQIDQIHAAGVSFGAGGSDVRRYVLASGAYVDLQLMPLRYSWLANLAKSTTTPFCPSQTLDSDYTLFVKHKDIDDEIRTQFLQNVKYGLYSYTYMHDYCFDPSLDYYINGVHASVQIRSAMEYLISQDVVFLPADQLVARLQDYIAGNIACTTNPDGSLTVEISRPGALANDFKISWKGDSAPEASGESVLSQQLIAEYLYVTLRPEVSSTVQIAWTTICPAAPDVTTDAEFITSGSVIQWEESIHPSGIAEYQYAVGSLPGGRDIQDWVSTGAGTLTTLDGAPVVNGAVCYVSVRARFSGGEWSPVGVSRPFTVDNTAPSCSITDDGSAQIGNTYLNADWIVADPESGILEAKYAVGTAPGLSDTVEWSAAAGNEINLTGLDLETCATYFVTVKARNGSGLWGQASTDGISIGIPNTIGLALKYADDTDITLTHVVVSAILPDVSYIEDEDRAAGAPITGLPAWVNENDELTISGEFQTSGMNRTWHADTCVATGSYVLRPIYVSNRYLGGSSMMGRPGPKNAIGLNNAGLLVTISGKVTEIGEGYIRVDDGSIRRSDSGGYTVKVQVGSAPPDLRVGSYVLATGISALEQVYGDYKRLLRTRRPADLVVILP